MEDIDITWEPTLKQYEALKSIGKHTYTVYGGSRGAGKSMLGRYWVLLRALKYPKTNHLILRAKLGDLRANHIDPLIELLGVEAWSEQKKRFTMPNGSKIILHYLRDKASADTHQGQEYASILIDEATQIQEEYLQKLYATLRTTHKSLKPKALLTCNPGGVSHGYIKRIINKQFRKGEKASDWYFVKAGVYDNPHLDKDYIAKLEALPEPIRSAWLNGDWDAFDGSFFNLSPKSNIPPYAPLPDEDYEVFLGLDHGTTHATAATLAIKYKRKYILVETYLAQGRTARAHAKEILDMCQANRLTKGMMPTKVYYDPAMATKQKLSDDNVRSVLDEYQEAFRSTNVEWVAANNDRVQGSQIMRELFALQETGEPLFYYVKKYNRQCAEYLHMLIPDDNNPEKYKKIDSDADDFADSLRYLLVGMYAAVAAEKEMQRATKTAHTYDYNNLTHRDIDWYSL